MNKSILTILLSILTITMTLAQKHNGLVYVDANANGRFDKGEKVLKDVAVSDGLNVVKTDRNGKFSLPGHRKEKFIFITTPSGYQTNNAHYKKIEHNSSEYNFGLTTSKKRVSKKGDHKFIHLADTEIFNTKNHEDWLSNIRNYATNEEVAFIMHTGDICYEIGLKEHIKMMNTESMDCPVFYAIGNHDLVEGDYGEQLFESIYGLVYFSFDVGNIHYIVTPMLSGDYKPSYTKKDVYNWLKNDIAQVDKGKPIIVFSHDLLTYSDEFKYGISDTEYVDLNPHNLKAWIYGHWHINLMKRQGDVYTICTSTPDKGGIDHSAANFRVIDVDSKGNINSHLRYPYINKSIEIASVVNNRIAQISNNEINVSVNTYDSNSRTKEVSYSCSVDNKQIAKGKLLQKSDWNWASIVKLSPKQIGKEIELRVVSTFNDGTTAETKKTFILGNNKTEVAEKLTNWETLLGSSSHNGVTNSNFTTPLSLAWTTNVGANIFMSSPIIYNGNIYVASVDENLKSEANIYALNGTNGEIVWKHKAANSIKNSIAAQDGKIFAQDVEANLYAIDAETGNLVWTKKLNQKGLPALVEGLTAKDGKVYAGTGKGLSAFDANSGNVLWTNEDWNQGEGATNTIAVDNNILVNGTQWGALYANDANTGKMLWSNNTNGLSDRGASAAIHNDLIYIISRSSLFIIEATTGRVVVRKELPLNVDASSTPLLTDKEIIFGSAQAGLVALDNETLDTKWQFETCESLIYTVPYTRSPYATVETSPVQSGETIFFGASDGVIYGINKKTGELKWKHKTGSPVLSTVSISGNVYAFISNFEEK